MIKKKANVVAAILIGVVILAIGAIILSKTVQTDKVRQDRQQRLTSEADNTMNQAISLGISEWMENGFSDKNKVWYSNYPLPPDYEEAKAALNNIVNKKVDSYLGRLESEDETYDINDAVDVVFNLAPTADGNSMESLSAQSSDFTVGLTTSESTQSQDISRGYTFGYRAWLIYTKMYEWHTSNADTLTQDIFDDAIMAKSCQLLQGGCDCADIGFSQAEKDSIKLTAQDVTAVLDAKLALLQQRFQGTGIQCKYRINVMNLENTENTYFTAGDAGPNTTIKVVPRPDEYNYQVMNWQETKTLPSAGEPNGGLPSTVSVPGVTVRPDLQIENAIINTYNESSIVNEECTGALTRMGALAGGEANLAQSMKILMLAMDKKVAALVTWRCEDPAVTIESDEGLVPIGGEITMRFAIALDCPMPLSVRDLYVDPALYDMEASSCPGGSCFPAGTLISMADGSKRSIELVNVGDSVLGYNTATGETRTGTVLELESPVREGLYLVSFSDGTGIKVTNEHPFYARSSEGTEGWASIIPEETYKETKTIDNLFALKEGYQVLNEQKEWVTILSIDYIPGIVQTYNLKEVSGYDNFFADEKLVHNKCCFAAGTPVRMADGTEKPIEQVNVGDFVLSHNLETGMNEASEVLELQKPVREGLYHIDLANGVTLKVTNDHPLYCRKASGAEGWAAVEPDAALNGYALATIMALQVGDGLKTAEGFIEVAGIKYVPGEVQTYTLKKVSRNMNFFAGGVLAHNQKTIGFIGLACPIECPVCTGCAPAEGVSAPRQGVPEDWQCVAVPNLICGKCGLCDASGQCTIPQLAGYPCAEDEDFGGWSNSVSYEEGNCMACNGVGTGDEACVMNPPGIENFIDKGCGSAHPCAKCDGSGRAPAEGGCSMPYAEDAVCNDLNVPETQRLCMKCAAGVVGTCQQDTEMIGELCSNCASCSAAGTCTDPAPESEGNCANAATPCRKCSTSIANACEVDLSRDSECGACQQCAADGSCEADTSKNGQSCGTCKICQNGQCVAGNEGQQCRTDSGCIWACQAGNCMISNAGSTCTRSSNTCGLAQTCGTNGCETVDRSKQCCGTAVCDSGSPCCNQLNLCGQCPSSN